MTEDYTKDFDENLVKRDSLLIDRDKENSLLQELMTGFYSGDMSQNASIYGSNVITVQQRFNAIFQRFVFIGSSNDGLTQSAGTGTITRSLLGTTFISGANSTCSLYSAEFSSGGTALNEISWGYSHEFLVSAGVYGANTTYDIFMGAYGTQSDPIPDDATSVVRHIGFFITDSDAVYASNADGTTQTKTQITGLTLNQFNTFRYIFITSKDIKFYVNDILVAIHTTNLPSGTDAQDPGILIGVEGQGDPKTLHVSNNYSILINRA